MSIEETKQIFVDLLEKLNILNKRVRLLENHGYDDDESKDSEIQTRVRNACKKDGMKFYFHRAPKDYYNWPLKKRGVFLGCNIRCLCKSVLLENQAWDGTENDDTNSHYYLCIVQYISKLDTEYLRTLVKELKEKSQQLSKKKFHFQLADEATSFELSGFEHNGVTPCGMKQRVPMILSKAITELPEQGCWLGGGEIDLKLWVNIPEFIDTYHPFILDCTHIRPEYQ